MSCVPLCVLCSVFIVYVLRSTFHGLRFMFYVLWSTFYVPRSTLCFHVLCSSLCVLCFTFHVLYPIVYDLLCVLCSMFKFLCSTFYILRHMFYPVLYVLVMCYVPRYMFCVRLLSYMFYVIRSMLFYIPCYTICVL